MSKMNSATVLIEDDDVDVLEPVKTCDDNINTGHKQNTPIPVDTIILDEDEGPNNHETVSTKDNPSPVTANEIVTSNKKDSSPAAIRNETLADNDKNSSFARLLKNNTLLNKIVKRCLTMANNAGMSRVVNKTLLPLYADADNKFKESEQFTVVLNKILSNLKYDPDHKFLHIKSLCEELKAGKYRRKVPFITLTTDVNSSNGFVPGCERFTKEKRKKAMKDSDINEKTAIINLDDYNLKKKRRRVGNINKKTAVIDLDNSDDECVIYLDVDNEHDDDDDAVVVTNVNDGHDTIVASNDEYDHDKLVAENDNNGDDETSNDVVMVIDDNSDGVSDLSNKENNIEENDNNKTSTCLTYKTISYINNKTNPNISKNNDNTQNVPTGDISTSKNMTEMENTSELLIPKRSVIPHRHSLEFSRAVAIENQIAIYKEEIAKLEKEEVTYNNLFSPYILCGKYKAKIVQLYKKLCKLTGCGDVNVMKPRVVRLQVIDGHPPGPTRMLEQYLNSTIDETGHVPLPDFHDVVKCVSKADIADGLGWKKEQIMREAIALFTQCGHALRKSRQRREYKDLVQLVREVKQDDPDDYDPANDDPLLRAKLEENKLIAKANENEIFERFVQMERLPNNSETVIPRACNIMRITSGDDSDTDSELDLPQPKINRTSEIQHNHGINKENSNEKIHETAGVNSPSESRNNMLLPPLGTTLDKFVNASTIQNAIDKTVINEFNSMSSNARITSSQTILNLPQGDKTNIAITPEPMNIATEYPLNTRTQNPINAVISNPIATQYTHNILYNALTQNTILTTTPHFANRTLLNPSYITKEYALNNMNNATQYTTNSPINNQINKPKTDTTTRILWSNTLQKVGSSNRYVVSFDSNTSQNNAKEKKDDHKVTDTDPKSMNSENVKVKTEDSFENGTIDLNTHVTFDTSRSENIAKENGDEHNITEVDPNILDCENVKVKTEERSSENGTVDLDTHVTFDTNISEDIAKEKGDEHNITEVDPNILDSENVKVKTEEGSIENETIDLNTHVTFDTSTSEDIAKEKEDDITKVDPNMPNNENVKVKTEEDSVKKEPIDISAMLSALGDNYLTTIFDIEDPFLVIEISSDSSSDDES